MKLVILLTTTVVSGRPSNNTSVHQELGDYAMAIWLVAEIANWASRGPPTVTDGKYYNIIKKKYYKENVQL